MKQLFLFTVIAAAFSLAACSKQSDPLGAGTTLHNSANAGAGYHIVPNGTYKGHSWSEWSNKWWQWAIEMPAGHNAIEGTAAPETDQTGDVWFIGGLFGNGGTGTRSITLPKEKALFCAILNYDGDTVGGFPTYSNLNTLLQGAWDGSMAHIETAEIDGHAVANVATDYFAPLTDFTIHGLPSNNVFGEPTYGNKSVNTYAASLGDYLMIDNFSEGAHTIHFTGSNTYGYSVDMTYNITVK
jgi:hypothetical protein